MSYAAPYAGLRVVDLSQGVAGPYCAMLLAQYGADVIKVEPPEGDWARLLGRVHGDHTAFSIAANLGKRAIVLDLKNAADKARLWQLIESADVFLEGFRPGVIERLGFAYPAAAARNPGLLYLSVSGYGQTGPLSAKPAMDPILQAFSGLMASNPDKDGAPLRIAPIIIDMVTALYGFQALAPALYARRELDEGRYMEVSLMQGAANLQVVRMMQTHLLGHEPQSPSAPSGAFACREGYILVVAIRHREFATLCRLLGLDDLADDPRFATVLERVEHGAMINRRIGEAFAKRTAAEWCAILTEAGLQNEQVLDYLEFLRHPQVAATGLISWLDQPGLDEPVPLPNPPGTPRLKPNGRLALSPTLGQHTDDILAALAATGEPWHAAR